MIRERSCSDNSAIDSPAALFRKKYQPKTRLRHKSISPKNRILSENSKISARVASQARELEEHKVRTTFSVGKGALTYRQGKSRMDKSMSLDCDQKARRPASGIKSKRPAFDVGMSIKRHKQERATRHQKSQSMMGFLANPECQDHFKSIMRECKIGRSQRTSKKWTLGGLLAQTNATTAALF